MNWLDASGRYMLVRYGAEPSVHLYDRTNFSAGPYANPIDATRSVGFGLGLSPDGQFVVGYDGRAVGYGGMGQGLSWRIDHVNRALPVTPNYFWGLCGNHGAFVSASDGRNYMAVSDCFSGTQLWRVDITNAVGDQSPGTGPDVDAQHAMPNNKLLASWPTPGEGAGHVSAVAAGPLRDWVFYATEDRDDTFDGGTGDNTGRITPWHAYRQEIMAINVMTGEIRRLAHHRSRLDDDYYSQPHVSASWKGAVVGFSSNFNQPGTQGEPPVTDVYAIPFVFPAPSLSSLSPVNVGGGPDGFVLTVSGRNFDRPVERHESDDLVRQQHRIAGNNSGRRYRDARHGRGDGDQSSARRRDIECPDVHDSVGVVPPRCSPDLVAIDLSHVLQSPCPPLRPRGLTRACASRPGDEA